MTQWRTKASGLRLEKVTLVCVSGVKEVESLFALWISARNIEFGAIKFIGIQKPQKLPPGINYESAIKSKLDSIDSYSSYVLYDLWRHIETEFCLIVQADGFIINANSWRDEFLDFDYVGAPWIFSESAYIDPFGNHQRVGNGGFSLRSRKLLHLPQKVEIPWEVNEGDFYKHMGVNLYSEDGNICVHNRHIFEANGIRFSEPGIAADFSVENKTEFYKKQRTFGFHKNIPNILTRLRIMKARISFNKVLKSL